MFERFGDDARRVVVRAQEEARLLGHDAIGTEHVLLALADVDRRIVFDTFRFFELTHDALQGRIEELTSGGAAPTGHIPFTRRAKSVLELSLREALQLGHNYIGTEHILLGLIREGEGVAAQVLVNLGADLPTVRTRVLLILSGYTEASSLLAPRGTGQCSFCLRAVSEVPHYAPGHNAAICDECITAAHAALADAPADQKILEVPPREPE